jgi:mRNA-degrading endonuclease HigB of HigAB toxin-antitoxin module
MVVVGAGKLRAFWEKHPAAAPALRALYALLEDGEWASRAALRKALGETAAADDAGLVLTLGETRVLLKDNCAAGTLLIVSVEKGSP